MSLPLPQMPSGSLPQLRNKQRIRIGIDGEHCVRYPNA